MRKTRSCNEIIQISVPQQARRGIERLLQKPLGSLLRLAVQSALSATVRLAGYFLLEPLGLFQHTYVRYA